MYYSKGNYEAFARPRKPENVENKSAYLVGSGLAALAAACFLIRDGQMKGSQVHILEELPKPGGMMVTNFLIKATSYAVVERWKITSSVCGIYSVQFLP